MIVRTADGRLVAAVDLVLTPDGRVVPAGEESGWLWCPKGREVSAEDAARYGLEPRVRRKRS